MIAEQIAKQLVSGSHSMMDSRLGPEDWGNALPDRQRTRWETRSKAPVVSYDSSIDRPDEELGSI